MRPGVGLPIVVPLVAAAICPLGAAPAPAAWPLRLSEIEASGSKTFVEIENTGRERVSLHGFAIQVERIDNSDDRTGRFLFEFPPDLFVPGSVDGNPRFFVACFGGLPKGNQDPSCSGNSCTQELCIPFDLDQDGGVVRLYWRQPCTQLERELVDGVTYPPLPTDAVFGRDTRTADASWCIFERKTPGAPNFVVGGMTQLCGASSGRVVINEVASAGSIDWIEILFTGSGSLFLGDYVLVSRSSPPVELPNVILSENPAGAVGCDLRRVVLVLANGVEKPATGCPERIYFVPTTFALSARGESLELIPSAGPDWDRVVVPALNQGEYYVRVPDAGPFAIIRTATPTSANPITDEKIAPDCEVIDRFPLRLVPGVAIDIYARVIDRDGQDDLERVELLLQQEGAAAARSISMSRSKRITCERFEEPGIFWATIPPEEVASPGTIAYWIEAVDKGGLASKSIQQSLYVQDPDWQDALGAHHLRINEVAANMPDVVGDWVEIFNASPDPGAPDVYLGNMYLTEDVFQLDGRALTPVAGEDLYLRSGEHVVITLGDGVQAPGARLSFRLDPCRDELLLIHEDRKTVIDQVSFHEEKTDLSLGRVPDGGTDLSVLPLSPGRSNVFEGQANCFRFKEPAVGVPPRLVINEICSDNWTSGKDKGGEYGDWVEIFNPTSTPQSLDCWRLSDLWNTDAVGAKPRKLWQFPDGVLLAAGGFLLVWCDNDDDCETSVPGELHTSFQLNRGADFLQLLDPCGDVVDALAFTLEPRDISIGRFPDGESAGAFLEPTPGAPNTALPEARGQYFQPLACDTLPVHATLSAPTCNGDRRFRRGRANPDCRVDLADAVFTLAWLFLGGPEPGCMDATDANDDGVVNLADAINTLNYLFLGGAAPPRPGPDALGCDPTEDALGCNDPGCRE